MGKLIDIHELQAVPEFDLETINRILPYVAVQKSAETFNVPVGKMLYQGRNDLTLRYSRFLETARGFTPVMEDDLCAISTLLRKPPQLGNDDGKRPRRRVFSRLKSRGF